MLKRVTQGTSRASMILLATVVFPDALPPQIPNTSHMLHLKHRFPDQQTNEKTFL